MANTKIKLKSKGECYVLSFLEALKEKEGDVEKAYNSLRLEFCEEPYCLPKEWWEDTICTTDLPTDYETKKTVKINGYYIPTAFIDYVE